MKYWKKKSTNVQLLISHYWHQWARWHHQNYDNYYYLLPATSS